MAQLTLDREEYIEQAYFFRVYRERLEESVPAQSILDSIHEEILSTTNLPMAIDFLRGEILLTGRVGDGMARLAHYFTPFQVFDQGDLIQEKSIKALCEIDTRVMITYKFQVIHFIIGIWVVSDRFVGRTDV